MTLAAVHPTAVVDPGAELGHEVPVGPYAVIGPQVQVGDGCVLGPHTVLERNVRLGAGVSVAAGAVLSGPPQDILYRDEETWVDVGPGTVIREHTTINRATAASGMTLSNHVFRIIALRSGKNKYGGPVEETACYRTRRYTYFAACFACTKRNVAGCRSFPG